MSDTEALERVMKLNQVEGIIIDGVAQHLSSKDLEALEIVEGIVAATIANNK